MLRTIASYLFLIDSLVIGLGAFGHGSAVRNIHAGIDHFPLDAKTSTIIYIVWYFVSGCMLVFGATLVRIWLRLRAGEADSFYVAYLIGALYLATGVGGMIYRQGDAFMAFFALLGALLLASSYVLSAHSR
jgi:hypothetical protein